jgi:hypothetical protein
VAESERRYREAEQAARLAERRAVEDAKEAERRAARDAAERDHAARIAARKEVARTAREARRAGKSARAVAADIERTALGTAVAKAMAREQRALAWRIAAPLLAARLTLDEVAMALNDQGVPRLRGGSLWTRSAVSQLRLAMAGECT